MLVAIAIPVFTTQLEKSREATDMSNLRAGYAEVMAAYLADGATGEHTATVSARQTVEGWQNPANGTLLARVDGKEYPIEIDAKISGSAWTIEINTSESALVKVK